MRKRMLGVFQKSKTQPPVRSGLVRKTCEKRQHTQEPLFRKRKKGHSERVGSALQQLHEDHFRVTHFIFLVDFGKMNRVQSGKS
jgi:hypothetical protein